MCFASGYYPKHLCNCCSLEATICPRFILCIKHSLCPFVNIFPTLGQKRKKYEKKTTTNIRRLLPSIPQPISPGCSTEDLCYLCAFLNSTNSSQAVFLRITFITVVAEHTFSMSY